MTTTLTNLLFHVVFSTKGRRPFIDDEFAERLHAYVQHQQEHHARHSFEDEFRLLLEKHGIVYDSRYVFD